MATNLEQLLVRIDATTEGLRRELKRAEGSIDSTARKVDIATKKIDDAFLGVTRTIKRDLMGSFGLLGTALSAQKVIQYADTWKQLEGRLRVATKSQSEFNSVQSKLIKLADENRTDLTSTINLYTKLRMAVGENQKALSNILPVTEAISKGIAITGESSAAAQGAITQFAQGLATNFSAAGQEIRSLQEQAPRVAKALADGLNELGVTSGATAGQLNKLAKDGVITAENAMAALATQLGVLRKEMEQTPLTIGQALTKLDNAFLKLIGQSEALNKGTGSLTIAITKLAENLEVVASVAQTAAIIIGGKYAASLLSVVSANALMLAGTIRVQYALAAMAGQSALATTGIFALAGAMKALKLAIPFAAVAFLYEMVDGNESLKESQKNLNDEVNATKEKLQDTLNVHGKLTEKSIEEVQKRIEAYKKEVQALEEILKLQLDNRTQAGLMLRGMRDFAGETVVEGMFGKDYQSLDETIKKQEQYQAAIKDLEGSLTELSKKSEEAGKATGGLTDKQEESRKELEKLIEKRKEYAGDLIVELARLRALEQESSRSIEAHDALKNAIDAETEAREKGFEVGTKEFEVIKYQILQREQLKDKIEANIEAHKKAADEAEEQQKRYAEALMKPFENAFENVQDELAKMLQEGKFNFESLASIAKKMAAEVAAAWIIRPVLAGTLNAAGIGGSGGGFGGAGGGFGGISSLSSIGSLFSGGGSLNQPIFSSGSFIGGGIDSIGQAIGLGGSNFIGPMPAGQVAPLSSNFTPMAGIASIGGSIAANLLGVKGGTGTSVGGTLGGIAGTAIGGPIGGFIGSLAGSALGSLFNKKPSSKLQGGTIDLAGGGQTSTYGLTGKKFSQENADAASALLQVGQSIALAIGEISGKTIKESLRAEVGGRGVGYAFGDGETIGVGTAGEALKGITQGIIDLTDKSAQGIKDLQLALEKIDFKDAEQAMTELQFALNFSTLGDLPKQMSFVEQAVKEMNRQFDEAEAMAKKLGLSVERLAEMELKRLDAALGELSRGISRDLLAQVAPNELAVIDEQQRYIDQLKDLALLNAKASDYKVAEVLHQVRMKQLTEEVNGLQASALTFEQSRLEKASEIARRFDAVGGNFRKIIFDLQYGQFANETPVENLSNMRSLVQQLGEQAAMGDADAAEQLSELLPAFVQLSGEVNGFNAQFAVDRNLALAVSKSALSTAERQVQLQSQIASAAQQQIQVLQSGFAQLAAALQNSGLSTQDVIDSATQSGGLLRSHETASVLSQTGGSGVSLATERAIKASLGFNFSTATGQFRDYAQASGQADAYRAAIRAAGGTPEFNTGGLVSGAGGVDKIHAKLTDGEFVMRAAAVRGIGASNLHAMNAKAGMPANNNGELAGRLDTLIKAVGQLAQVTAASGEVQSAQLSSVNRELASIRRDAGLAASA